MAVKYGKRGGISYKNTDWRSYYGAENYDRYVAQKKAEHAKSLKESEEKRKALEEFYKALDEDPKLREIYEAEYFDAIENSYEDDYYDYEEY